MLRALSLNASQMTSLSTSIIVVMTITVIVTIVTEHCFYHLHFMLLLYLCLLNVLIKDYYVLILFVYEFFLVFPFNFDF
jgi:predicted membrane protein